MKYFPPQVSQLQSSVAMIPTAGRLGNSMSTLTMVMGLQSRGFTPVIDLANYQILSATFSNIAASGVQILEELFCDPSEVTWEHFNQPLDQLNVTQMSKGKAIIFWISGVSVEESVHGFARLATPNIDKLRSVFTFRHDHAILAKARLRQIVKEYLATINRKAKRKLSENDLDIVGVHIRRTDHIQHEQKFGYTKLNRNYFIQAMEKHRENLKHPVFVMVTDDVDWVVSQIPRQRFKYFLTGMRIYNAIL